MTDFAKIRSDLIIYTYSETTDISPEYMLHCHNNFEIYYYIEGDVDYLVEGRAYRPTPHSLLLLSPNVFHGVKVNSASPYKRIALHFNPELITMERRHFLLSSFPSMEKHSGKEIYYQNLEEYRLFSFFESFNQCALLDADTKEWLLPVYLEALLSQIKVMSLSNKAAVINSNVSDTVSKIIYYLNQHLAESFSLDQISDRFFISKHHLNKVFKKATGTTVGDYLIYKRIVYAQQLLINGCSAGQAAEEAGFYDYSSFYRAYTKRFGHSPLTDRELVCGPNKKA